MSLPLLQNYVMITRVLNCKKSRARVPRTARSSPHQTIFKYTCNIAHRAAERRGASQAIKSFSPVHLSHRFFIVSARRGRITRDGSVPPFLIVILASSLFAMAARRRIHRVRGSLFLYYIYTPILASATCGTTRH